MLQVVFIDKTSSIVYKKLNFIIFCKNCVKFSGVDFDIDLQFQTIKLFKTVAMS